MTDNNEIWIKMTCSFNNYKGYDKEFVKKLNRGEIKETYDFVRKNKVAYEWWNFYDWEDDKEHYYIYAQVQGRGKQIKMLKLCEKYTLHLIYKDCSTGKYKEFAIAFDAIFGSFKRKISYNNEEKEVIFPFKVPKKNVVFLLEEHELSDKMVELLGLNKRPFYGEV